MNGTLLRNIASLAVLQGANYLLPLLTLPYLVRTLGTEAYGQLAFSLAVTQYFVLLTDYGFNLSGTRAIAQQQHDVAAVSRTFWSVLACKLALAAVGLALLLVLIALVPAVAALARILLPAYLLVLGSALFPLWLFQGLERMGKVLICSVGSKALVLPLIFLQIHGPGDNWRAGAIQGLTSVVAGLIALWLVHRDRLVRWVAPTPASIRGQLAAGRHVFISTAAVSLYTTSNSVLLGLLAGNGAVGSFVAADKIQQALQGLTVPISQAVYPRINALMSRSRGEAFRLIRGVLLGQGTVMLAVSCLLYLSAGSVVHLAYGAGHGEVSQILRWLAFLPFVVGISNVLGIQIMLPLGLNVPFSRILLGSGLINLLMLVPLVLLLAGRGAAISVLVTESLVTAAMAWTLHRRRVPLFEMAAADAL